MKTSLRLLALSLGFLLAAGARAQLVATAPAELGQRTVTLDYQGQDYVHGPHDVNGTLLAVNIPVTAGYDAGLSYGWLHALSHGVRVNQNQVLANFTGYNVVTGSAKAFLGVSAGGTWVDSNVAPSTSRFTYGATAGAELAVAPAFFVTPYVSYLKTKDLTSNEAWAYGLNANWKVSRQFSVNLGAALDNYHDVAYNAGVSFKF